MTVAARRSRVVALMLGIALLPPAAVEALTCSVSEIRGGGGSLRAGFEARDAFAPKRFRQIVDGGGALFLRLETEVWQDRPVWDRLVQPALVTVYRVLRESAGAVTVQDAAGVSASYEQLPPRLSLVLDLGPLSAYAQRARYYVHARFTVGTVEEREIEGASDAVFGGNDAGNLAALGRFFFRKVLQVSDYLLSESCEAARRQFTLDDVRK